MRSMARIGLIAVLLCIAPANALQAASFTYSDQVKTIRAGVLIFKDTVNPNYYPDPKDRPDPYVFYVMDARQDLKPAGWSIVNPLAPSNVTRDIYARWRTIEVPADPKWSRPYVYALGQSVTKQMACYWEVQLDTRSEDLAQYDILLMTNYGFLNFSQKERETLRKFVDDGGILWIEHRKHSITGQDTQFNASASVFTSFFLRGLEFDLSSGAGNPPAPAMTADTALSHSLVSRPFPLLWKDISMLGRGRTDPGGVYYPDYANTSIIRNSGMLPDAHRYCFPIIMRNGNPVVVAAQYGSGYVVVSAESIGQAISEPVGPAGVNDGTYMGLLPAANSEDLRFAYNIVSWGSEHTTLHKSARRPGYSFAEIGAPLTPLWSYTTPCTPDLTDHTDRSPAILDDAIFYVDEKNVLHAFDLSPVRDRDHDPAGDPDDGIRDYSLGAEYDELWNYDLAERSSSPTVAYVPMKSDNAVIPMVFIQTQSGRVLGFDASSPIWPQPEPDRNPTEYFTTAKVKLNEFKVVPKPDPIPAPTYVDGTLYAGDGAGLLHAHRFFPDKGAEWAFPDPQDPPNARAAYSPTVGYLYDPVTGATEQVAYCAFLNNSGGTNGIVNSYPIKVFNETLAKDSDTQYHTRSRNTPILPDDLTWHVYYQRSTGAITELPHGPGGVDINPPGNFIIHASLPSDVTRVFADYQLNYDPNLPFPNRCRPIAIQAPTSTNGEAGITGSPALSKKDILYFGTKVISGLSLGGDVYAVKESAEVQAIQPLTYKWRWHLPDFLPAGTAPFGSPAVAGDMVYFAANDIAANQGYILAFRADPEFKIKLPTPISSSGARPIFRQQDEINPETASGNGGHDYMGVVPTNPNNIPIGATFLINYEAGELQFVNFRRSATGGQLSVSHDATILYTPAPPPDNPQQQLGQVPFPVKPFDVGWRAGNPDWNNLVWYMPVQGASANTGVTITSSPMVMGDILYVGLFDGSLGEIDLERVRPNPELFASWVSCAWAEYPDPQSSNGLPMKDAVAGSHGMLVAASSSPQISRLSVLYSPVTLITEPDRIAEINAAGKKTWVCDATISYTSTRTPTSTDPGNPVYGANKTPFNKPSVARQATIGGTIVADTGNNRIVHIDRAGTLLWEVATFLDASQLLPPGSSLALNKPSDVVMWANTLPDDPADDPLNPKGPTHPAYHYLIADSGSYRVVEIVAKFISAAEADRLKTLGINVPANTYQNVLQWTTKTLAEGKQYRFTTARPGYVLDRDQTTGEPLCGNSLLSVVFCTISNYDTNDMTTDVTGGALMQVDMTTGTTTLVTGLPVDSAAPTVHLFNPTFFNRQYVSNTEWHDVVIDAVGIHVVNSKLTLPECTISSSIRNYTLDDHKRNTNLTDPPGRPLAPSYAQYLPNGHVLVSSRAMFDFQGKQCYGEILELTPNPDPTKSHEYILNSFVINDIRQPMSAERQIL